MSGILIGVTDLPIPMSTRGEIKPEYIIESAKNHKSALHGYFEWNDEKAAHGYRLAQANRLLSVINVKIVTDGGTKSIKAFHLTKHSGIGSKPNEYKSVDIMSEKDMTQIKKYIVVDLQRIKSKLLQINTRDVIEHIDKAIEALNKAEEAKVIPVAQKQVEQAV